MAAMNTSKKYVYVWVGIAVAIIDGLILTMNWVSEEEYTILLPGQYVSFEERSGYWKACERGVCLQH